MYVPQVPEVHVTAKALLPSTSVIAFTLGNGLSFTTFVNTVPINANKTINRFALVRKLGDNKLINGIFNAKIWDSTARQAMIKCVPTHTEDTHLQICSFTVVQDSFGERCSSTWKVHVVCIWCILTWLCDACFRILSEDREMVEKVLPEHLLAEMSVKADLPQTAFRRLRQASLLLSWCSSRCNKF